MSEARELVDGALVAQIPRIQRRRGLEEKDFDLLVGDGQMLKAQIQKLNQQLRLLNDRLAELEKPRGLRAWFGRLFGRGKPKVPATTVSAGKNLEEAAKKVPS